MYLVSGVVCVLICKRRGELFVWCVACCLSVFEQPFLDIRIFFAALLSRLCLVKSVTGRVAWRYTRFNNLVI